MYPFKKKKASKVGISLFGVIVGSKESTNKMIKDPILAIIQVSARLGGPKGVNSTPTGV
ncbi:hypothetical protein ES708_30077 [subsurface metagenome]